MRVSYKGGRIVNRDTWIPKRTAKDRAKRCAERRWMLIMQLGGKCANCRTRKNLEIHHKNGRLWEPWKTSRWRRIKRYEQEAKAGLLEVLCSKCNKKVGKPKMEEPFV